MNSSIQLPGLEIDRIEHTGNELRIGFSRAYIIKTITGSKECSLWWQAAWLILEDAHVDKPIPMGRLICSGGEVGENIYTYRDMIPIPLQSRGRTHCNFGFQGRSDRLIAYGQGIRLELIDVPKYIEHLRI